MSVTYLKVKIASLAAEARIIRKLERNHRRMSKGLPKPQRAGRVIPHPVQVDEAQRDQHRVTWLGLKSHRRFEVRRESRASHLAYGFLRGMPYLRIENTCYEAPDWDRVARLVQSFDPKGISPLPNVRSNALQVIKDDLKTWSETKLDVAKAA